MSRESSERLRIRGLSVVYDRVPALRDVDLTLGSGELVALLGPSGSGKSTLLHAVAGFLPIAAGEITLGGELVASARGSRPPERRDVAMVFQHFALWPHLSVQDTVAYPLRRKGVARDTARAEAQRLLERLRIGHLRLRRPAELSGGEQQRAGLARALAKNAALYLFDEPTAHLDTHVRAVFLEEVVTRQRATGASALYATHDAAEALAVADRVALLDGGRVVQLGPPDEVYAEPSSLWSAQLTGPASLVTGRLVGSDATTLTLDLRGTIVRVPASGPSASAQPAAPGSATGAGVCQVLVRPDWVSLTGPLSGRVDAVRYRGPYTDIQIETDVGQVLAREPGMSSRRPGDPVSWGLLRAWVLPGTASGATVLPDGDGGSGPDAMAQTRGSAGPR